MDLAVNFPLGKMLRRMTWLLCQSSSCYHRTPQTQWLEQQPSLRATEGEIEAVVDLLSGEGLIAGSKVAFVSLCLHVKEGMRVFWAFIYKSANPTRKGSAFMT